MAPSLWGPTTALHGPKSMFTFTANAQSSDAKTHAMDTWPVTHKTIDIVSLADLENRVEPMRSWPIDLALSRKLPQGDHVQHNVLLTPSPESTTSSTVSPASSPCYGTPSSGAESPVVHGAEGSRAVGDFLFSEALKEMAWVLCCEYDGIGLATLVAVESLFNVDSVLDTLPFLDCHSLPDSSQHPIEALAALLAALCSLRSRRCAQDGPGYEGEGRILVLCDVFCYVFRFNRLSKARGLETSWLRDWEDQLGNQLSAAGYKPQQILSDFIARPLHVDQ